MHSFLFRSVLFGNKNNTHCSNDSISYGKTQDEKWELLTFLIGIAFDGLLHLYKFHFRVRLSS